MGAILAGIVSVSPSHRIRIWVPCLCSHKHTSAVVFAGAKSLL